MRRRFLGLNFIQFVYIDYITCTFIILYGQEGLNHGGSNSIQGGNRKFLGCTQWSTIELEICWKYVFYEYTVTPSLLNSILSGFTSQGPLSIHTNWKDEILRPLKTFFFMHNDFLPHLKLVSGLGTWLYNWFHKKGTWSVHSFHGDYVSTPEGTGSCA